MSESSTKREILKLQRTLVDALEDVKAKDIQVFNTEHLSPLFERVIIASGSSNRQTRALAASVRDAVRATGADKPRVEGEDNGEWVIVDCGVAVVHIMQPIIREYYRLEEIWGDKPVKMRLSGKSTKLVKAEGAAEAEVKKPKRAAAKKVEGKTAAKPAAKTATKPASKSATKILSKPVVKAEAKPVAKKAASKTPARKTATQAPATQAVLKVAPKKSAAKKAPVRSAAKPAAKKAVVVAKRTPAAKKPAARTPKA